MPSFNYGRYLSLAIEGVLRQSYSDLELIIIDDCSGDNSVEIAQEWKRRDERVVLVRHDVNRGLAATRNSGLAASSGEFIALCDADDIWLSGKLAIQMECFTRDPQLALIHSDSAIIDADGALTGQRFSGLMHAKGQKTSGNLFDTLCRRNFICVPTVTLRKEALQYANGFDSRLRSLEDWVCWTQISRKYLFHYIADPLVQYRIHRAGLSSDAKGMARNRIMALEILLESLPSLPRRTRAQMLYALGVSQMEGGDSRAAVRAFAKSIGTDAVQLRGWIRFCQSLLDTAVSWEI